MKSITALILASTVGFTIAADSTAVIPGANRRMLLQFCGQCIWAGTIVCEARAQYLVDKYGDLTLDEARVSIFEDCSTDNGEPDGGLSVSLDIFCGSCSWKNMGFSCDDRAAFLGQNYKLSQEKAQESLLEQGHCIDPDADLGLHFCGECMWQQSKLSCDDKAQDLAQDNNSTLEETKVSIFSDCFKKQDSPSPTTANQNAMTIILFCGECMWQQSNLSCDDKAQDLARDNNDLTLEEAKVSILSDCFDSNNTTNQNTEESDEQQTDDRISTWAIVAIILAIILLLILIILLMLARRKKKSDEELQLLREEQAKKQDLENPAVAVPIDMNQEGAVGHRPDPEGIVEQRPDNVLLENSDPPVSVDDVLLDNDDIAMADVERGCTDPTERDEESANIDRDPLEAAVLSNSVDSIKEDIIEEAETEAPENGNKEEEAKQSVDTAESPKDGDEESVNVDEEPLEAAVLSDSADSTKEDIVEEAKTEAPEMDTADSPNIDREPLEAAVSSDSADSTKEYWGS